MQSKTDLRKKLRAARRKQVANLPDTMRGLVFRHPPAPLLQKIPEGAVIGLYHAGPDEAPTTAYAGYFQDRGHTIALPRFSARDALMEFATYSDPYGGSDLEDGPFGVLQPHGDAPALTPHILFVPLVGFTVRGQRLGQGGGHYDRWLAAHPGTPAIGMAWDCQLCDELPGEDHDMPLDAIITPTRLYGPF